MTDTIKITRGVYSLSLVKLADYDFTDVEKIVLTIKAKINGSPIIVKEFYAAEDTLIEFTPEDAASLPFNGSRGVGSAYYDFDEISTNGKRYKITENGKVLIVKGVGDVNDDQN